MLGPYADEVGHCRCLSGGLHGFLATKSTVPYAVVPTVVSLATVTRTSYISPVSAE